MRMRLLVLMSAVALGAAGIAAASSFVRPAAATPDPKPIVLRAADLHAKVQKQRYFQDFEFPSTISYERSFGPGHIGRTKLLHIESVAEIGANATTTARFIALLRQALASPGGTLTLKESFAREIGDPRLVNASLQIGRIRNLGAGAGSFDVPLTAKVLGRRVDIHVAVFHLDRILGGLAVAGTPGSHVGVFALTRLSKLMQKRMAAELVPKNVALPVVSGSPQVGQTLTGSSGLWNGSPTKLSYHWQRCSSAGRACAAIGGSTGQTYTLAQADAGSAIRVAVTARNRFGATTVRSAATAAVGTAAAPANTALPTIGGTAQVGQTLTATTGSWTGSPTSFGFQWQRCDAAGSTCVAIPGATAGTYVVAAADSGATLRVSVTATNAVGSATATSLPTTPVP